MILYLRNQQINDGLIIKTAGDEFSFDWLKDYWLTAAALICQKTKEVMMLIALIRKRECLETDRKHCCLFSMFVFSPFIALELLNFFFFCSFESLQSSQPFSSLMKEM